MSKTIDLRQTVKRILITTIFLLSFSNVFCQKDEIYIEAIKDMRNRFNQDSLIILKYTDTTHSFVRINWDSLLFRKTKIKFNSLNLFDEDSIINLKTLIDNDIKNVAWVDNQEFYRIMLDTNYRFEEKWTFHYNTYPFLSTVTFSNIAYNAQKNFAVVYVTSMIFGRGSGYILLFKKSKNKWKFNNRIVVFMT